ncbi:MAG: hypothetical protein F6K11_08525 [Leptolyngbya sp. SIO3F4]|nr:hypothetical protein [Leptolyngbya sp. SIO3F4]
MLRGSSFLLLAVICVPFWAGYLHLQWQHAQVRENVREHMIQGMDREELVLLTFTLQQAENELHWEHDREFEYRGEMYDVVETEQLGTTVKYWCWQDHEETRLNRQLRDWVAQALGQDTRHQEQRTSVWLVAQHMYPPVSFSWEVYHQGSISSTREFPYSANRLQRSDQPPVPPPRFVEHILPS